MLKIGDKVRISSDPPIRRLLFIDNSDFRLIRSNEILTINAIVSRGNIAYLLSEDGGLTMAVLCKHLIKVSNLELLSRIEIDNYCD